MNPKERPILFSGEMVRAILKGRKTQTRRIKKEEEYPISPAPQWYLDELAKECPYGQPGDRLWVKETWCNINKPEFEPEIYYRADIDNGIEDYDKSEWKWKPSIFMPRWASRILLEITNCLGY